MTPLLGQITVAHYLAVGAVLFVTGIACMATKRNALGVLMGVELVLNGANVNFVAFGSDYLRADSLGLDGQLMALFVIVLAAAEAAVALAIALNFYNNHASIDVDRADDLKELMEPSALPWLLGLATLLPLASFFFLLLFGPRLGKAFGDGAHRSQSQREATTPKSGASRSAAACSWPTDAWSEAGV